MYSTCRCIYMYMYVGKLACSQMRAAPPSHHLFQFIESLFVGGHLRLEGLVPQEFTVNVLCVAVRVVLRSDVLLAQLISEPVALLQELLQLQLVLEPHECLLREPPVHVLPVTLCVHRQTDRVHIRCDVTSTEHQRTHYTAS